MRAVRLLTALLAQAKDAYIQKATNETWKNGWNDGVRHCENLILKLLQEEREKQ